MIILNGEVGLRVLGEPILHLFSCVRALMTIHQLAMNARGPG